MQFTEKLWRGFETLGNGDAKKRQWIREAMIRRCLAMLGIGEAWTGRAAERQRKDVTCKGDEWPGNAAEEQGEETE